MASKKKASTVAKRKKKLGEKKKKLTARKKRLEKIEKRLRKVDEELAFIEKELRRGSGKSEIVEEDLKKLDRKLLHLEVEGKELKKSEDAQRFYRNFVFKCKKCRGEFEKRVDVPPVRKKFVCPACGRDHTLGLYPSSRFYHVYHSKDIEIKKPKE